MPPLPSLVATPFAVRKRLAQSPNYITTASLPLIPPPAQDQRPPQPS